MANRLWPLLIAVAVLVSGCGSSGPDAAEPERASAMPTVLILDASGSMNETDAPGPRIDAAKRAAQGLVDGLPDGTSTALLAYGTSTGSSDAEKAAGCQDVKVRIPMGTLDRQQMAAQISGLSASGYTPISLALRTAITQLPAGEEPQAIILVSDGEDTCGTPPCDTAREAAQKYPNVAISTVGFKTEGNASEQLRCIAEVTGGLFVQAQNANQLAARLLATRNVQQAQNSLSSNGIGDITLGASLAEIRKAHPDFPNAATSGHVVVVYRDCDFGFADGVLDSITQHSGGRTIDGVTPGTPISRVIELYGNAVKTETDGQGGYRLTFAADPTSDAGYRILVDNATETGGTVSGTVKTIVLCRCVGTGASAGAPDAVITFPDRGVDLFTQSGLRCRVNVPNAFSQFAPPNVICESDAGWGPSKDNGVIATKTGDWRWAEGNLGKIINKVSIKPGHTYRVDGWTVVADGDGARFTFDDTGSGIFVSIDDVHPVHR
ncbi:vWA domain-containing protein [[Mycobacterium] zoologicum]|uniref:vWA domain-containing protein n=1 Tax=[Mycobacterium] zoologicum TaxID=2872311 RepID=UPI001CDB059E|nr:VWA domain-containing protein [Mycolicibacter sp. MYC101]MEB3062228.1 VWA domain-containing protein [Mycolicibacter sp. MYC101]